MRGLCQSVAKPISLVVASYGDNVRFMHMGGQVLVSAYSRTSELKVRISAGLAANVRIMWI